MFLFLPSFLPSLPLLRLTAQYAASVHTVYRFLPPASKRFRLPLVLAFPSRTGTRLSLDF